MTPETKEYIVSERFIHDALAVRAARAYERACEVWARDGHISPTILYWPIDPVTDSNGAPYDGIVVAALPPSGEDRTQYYTQALKRLNPYGVMVVEITQLERPCLTGTFESRHGARHWSRAVLQHGDVLVLGPEVTTDNRQHLGVLWRPNRGGVS